MSPSCSHSLAAIFLNIRRMLRFRSLHGPLIFMLSVLTMHPALVVQYTQESSTCVFDAHAVRATRQTTSTTQYPLIAFTAKLRRFFDRRQLASFHISVRGPR